MLHVIEWLKRRSKVENMERRYPKVIPAHQIRGPFEQMKTTQGKKETKRMGVSSGGF
jgi:hypothetical protein